MRLFPRWLAPLAAALLLASAADAQRTPRRPALPADADSNDARAYYDLGVRSLERRPDVAADAFHWAAELRPGWADALYARHAALQLRDPRQMLRYQGEGRGRASAVAREIDSLYLHALRADPFVQRRFEREVTRTWIAASLAGGDPRNVDDPTLLRYYTETVMAELPPVMRARVRASQGRLPDAVEAFDEALRSRRNRGETRGWILHERARMFALAGSDARALEDLQAALDLQVEQDERELVRLYQSKAVLHHSRAMIHERAGDLAAAREAYARALEEDLAYAPAHVRLSVLALADGDTATAVAEMQLAAETAPADPLVRTLNGMLLTRLQRLDEAAAELQAAAQLAPHYAEPWIALGMLRDWQGDHAAAADAYRAFLARAPRDDARRAGVEPLVATAAPAP